MNIFTEIGLLFKLKRCADATLTEAKKMNGQKPGWKTSEFWLHTAVQIGSFWGAVSGLIPPKYAIIISAIGASVYNIGQIVLKTVNAVQAAKQDTTTVTTTQPVTTVTTPS